MTLADYLDQNALTATQFAKRIGVSEVSVCRYLSGQRRPEWRVMAQILTETEGKVTPQDFLLARDFDGKAEIRELCSS